MSKIKIDRSKMVPMPIWLPGLWKEWAIDEHPKIYRYEDGRDARDVHKKVKKIYESLSSEEKGKTNGRCFDEQFNKVEGNK